ncbi:MAG: hypothetical protein QM817_13770 [Archangium sp.]
MVVTPRSLLACAALFASAAFATTLLALDVQGLTKNSHAVVRGTVKSVSSRWTKDGGRIMTDAVIEVSETWKGAAVKQVTVMQPGGEVGDVGQLVHGTVKFKAGEEVVVFLEARGDDHFLLTGMVQGRFKVERSSDGKAVFARQELDGEALFLDTTTRQPVSPGGVMLPIDQLRAQVLSFSGATAPVETTRPGPVKVTP